jgi:thioredoxin reductase
MPQRLRHKVVATHLGPAPGWFARAQFEGRVPTHLSATLLSLTPQDGQLSVRFRDATGTEQQLLVDHLIAATGYKPRLDRLTFLDPTLAARIDTEGQSPRIDRNFQTTVPGLYMVGLAAANNFGPLLRFACGAEFTVKRLAPHLARQR